MPKHCEISWTHDLLSPERAEGVFLAVTSKRVPEQLIHKPPAAILDWINPIASIRSIVPLPLSLPANCSTLIRERIGKLERIQTPLWPQV